jgi:hypothetical protein
MRIETDEGFVSFIAKDSNEIDLLSKLMIAINSEDSTFPACMVDNLENGTEHRIIDGILQLKVSG